MAAISPWRMIVSDSIAPARKIRDIATQNLVEHESVRVKP